MQSHPHASALQPIASHTHEVLPSLNLTALSPTPLMHPHFFTAPLLSASFHLCPLSSTYPHPLFPLGTLGPPSTLPSPQHPSIYPCSHLLPVLPICPLHHLDPHTCTSLSTPTHFAFPRMAPKPPGLLDMLPASSYLHPPTCPHASPLCPLHPLFDPIHPICPLHPYICPNTTQPRPPICPPSDPPHPSDPPALRTPSASHCCLLAAAATRNLTLGGHRRCYGRRRRVRLPWQRE